MKKIFFIFVFVLLFSSCAFYTLKTRSPFLKEKAQEISAPLPDENIEGVQMHFFSRNKNMALSFTFQAGTSWKGEAKRLGNYEVGTETRIQHYQSTFEMGVVPFSKRIPYVFPYLGIGAGIISGYFDGLRERRTIDFLYPCFVAGIEIITPLGKKYGEVFPSLFVKGGYQFSFKEWLSGPYVSAGYSGILPIEGIFVCCLGALIIYGSYKGEAR